MSIGLLASINGTLATLTGRLTSARATLLDNLSKLDVITSTLATASALTTVGVNVNTLLGRLTFPRALNLDNLNATISSRLDEVIIGQVSGFLYQQVMSNGTGIDTRYRDITVSVADYTKVSVSVSGSAANAATSAGQICGAASCYAIHARLTSNSNLRISCVNPITGTAYVTCAYTLLLYN